MGSKRKYDDTESLSGKRVTNRDKRVSSRSKKKDESCSTRSKRRKTSKYQRTHKKSKLKAGKSKRGSGKVLRRGGSTSPLSKPKERKSGKKPKEGKHVLPRSSDNTEKRALTKNDGKLVASKASKSGDHTRLDDEDVTRSKHYRGNKDETIENAERNDISLLEWVTATKSRLKPSPRGKSKVRDKADEVFEKNVRWVAATLNNMSRKICDYQPKKPQNEQNFVTKLRECIDKGNKEAVAKFESRIGNCKVLRDRCAMLKSQLGSLQSRWKTSKVEAEKCEKVKAALTALQRKFKSTCEHNTKLLRELSEVKVKFQEQIAEKVEEISTLNDERASLTATARKFRGDIDKKQELQRLHHDEQLNKLRESHAKAVSRLKVQYKGLSLANTELCERNKELALTLNRFKIELPVTAGMNIVSPVTLEEAESPHSAMRKDLAELQRAKGSATELAMLKADAASLRASLGSKASQLDKLRKLREIYRVLSGVRVKKKELYFDCRIVNPEEKVKFDFSLIEQDNGEAILYEKVSWDSRRECSKYLNDCSGQFFNRNLAPLFLKNLINEVFSPKEKLGKDKMSGKDKQRN